jgi:hypothetical protein
MIRGTKTRRCAVEHDDLPHFVGWMNEPAAHRFMVIRYPFSIAQGENWW